MDLALNNQQWLIGHKTKTKSNLKQCFNQNDLIWPSNDPKCIDMPKEKKTKKTKQKTKKKNLPANQCPSLYCIIQFIPLLEGSGGIYFCSRYWFKSEGESSTRVQNRLLRCRSSV